VAPGRVSLCAMLQLAHPFFLSPSILDEETRKLAFQRTTAVLRECDQIRRGLELPPEALGHVLEVYIASAREVLAERMQADRAARRSHAAAILRSHEDGQPLRIKPGELAEVREFSQYSEYRVEEIEIKGDPSRWRVFEIKVGDRVQSPRLFMPPLSGELFRKGGIMRELCLEPCQRAMSISMLVEYVGPLVEGEVFEATLEGDAIL